MVIHPLKEGQRLEAHQPQCPCKGASYKIVTGRITKVISNSTGYWYYLGDIGITIRSSAVTRVFD